MKWGCVYHGDCQCGGSDWWGGCDSWRSVLLDAGLLFCFVLLNLGKVFSALLKRLCWIGCCWNRVFVCSSDKLLYYFLKEERNVPAAIECRMRENSHNSVFWVWVVHPFPPTCVKGLAENVVWKLPVVGNTWEGTWYFWNYCQWNARWQVGVVLDTHFFKKTDVFSVLIVPFAQVWGSGSLICKFSQALGMFGSSQECQSCTLILSFGATLWYLWLSK